MQPKRQKYIKQLILTAQKVGQSNNIFSFQNKESKPEENLIKLTHLDPKAVKTMKFLHS